MIYQGKIVALSVSKKKGIPKINVERATLIENYGMEGDAHAGNWHKQISMLAIESIEKMQTKGLSVSPGAFAENITTEFLDLLQLHIKDKILIGESVLEITQIGKECHTKCAIYHQAGDCVMPREGIFAQVLKGGIINVDDEIKIVTEKESIAVAVSE